MAPDHGSSHNLLALGLGISLGRVATPPCVGKNVCPLHGEHGEGETDKTGDTTGAFAYVTVTTVTGHLTS